MITKEKSTMELKRLDLHMCDINMLKKALEGDEALSLYLGCSISEKWNLTGVFLFEYAINRLSNSRAEFGWWVYFPVLKESNKLIGCCGYRGKPIDGEVELFFEIAEDQRYKGYATETVWALCKNAFEYNHVDIVVAYTLPELNPSTSVLKNNGFIRTNEFDDGKKGKVWRWQLTRSGFLLKQPGKNKRFSKT